MKGSLILTEGRSGSNWLISLTNGTGLLGNGGEWFAAGQHRPSPPKTVADLLDKVLAKATTENGYFCVKLFPVHLYWAHVHFGIDLIQHFREHHDVNLVRLTRTDRLRQAISYAKGVQTSQWTQNHAIKRSAEYDFDMICRCFFLIERSDNYWNAYLSLRQLSAKTFVYEDMLKSPRPFVECLADHCGCEVGELPPSKHSIQRDASTEIWLRQFMADLDHKNVVGPSAPARQPKRSLSNMLRLVRRRPLKPYPYAY